MQSAKKSTRILSALSMAATAALAASAAHAAPTLSLYYGEDTSYANSNNSVLVGTGYNAATTTFNDVGEPSVFTSATAVSVPAGATSPVTITVPIGDYLSLAVDAVVTGNTNTYAGKTLSGHAQPAVMGLSELAMAVSSSDANATFLTPLPSSGDSAGTPDTTVNGVPAYTSTANVNNTLGSTNYGSNDGTSAPAPTWGGVAGGGNVAPNEPGFSGSSNQGGVGFFNGALVGVITGGNTSAAGNSASGVNSIKQFSGASATYAASTNFFDNLVFQALKAGTVTLNTFDITNGTEYWINPTPTSTTPNYAPSSSFDGKVNALPLLVIDITNPIVSTSPILSYGATAPAGYGTQVGTLTVTGHNGSYNVAEVDGLTGQAGYVGFGGFTPVTDQEIFALDVTGASSAQLADIVTDIDAIPGLTASTTAPAGDPFKSFFDVFVDITPGASPGFLGFNLANDANLAGTQVAAVAVVPEPMTLGLLALGGVGLMARRHRRKA